MVVENFPVNREVKADAKASPESVNKIKSLAELEDIVTRLRARGKEVVLAHGVFDLLHMGHIRHLNEARSHGDVLIVTLTADAFVNKGPGKPAFSERLRAEMLAALSVVDFVAINHSADAEGLLLRLRPDVYAKGSDYRDSDADVTGKINREREAVETNSGRIVFTDDITFSSTELLNRHFELFDPQIKDFLDRMRSDDELEMMLGLVDKAESLKVLIVGDAIIDEYRYVVPMGKSPKENMIATRFESKEAFAGGAIATANHVAGLCGQVDLLTSLGSGTEDEELIRRSLHKNVTLHAVRQRGIPTTRKVRFIEKNYFRKLFEVYHFEDSPMPRPLQHEFDDLVRERANDYDLVIVNDFGHGLIASSTIDLLCRRAKFLAVNAQTNSANFGFNLVTRYPRADLVCIDTPEAQLAVGSKFLEPSEMVGRELPALINCDRIILTLGKGGCSTWQRGETVQSIPAFAKSVIDLVGAGDAFLAVSSILAAAGGSMREVGFAGNVAGALKVGIVGHRSSIDKAAIVKSITGLLK
jgi:rfaE bifunctional protein kinase chain/domain/rfaE bifunctional protein nucleotidyltransferase chain/domain